MEDLSHENRIWIGAVVLAALLHATLVLLVTGWTPVEQKRKTVQHVKVHTVQLNPSPVVIQPLSQIADILPPIEKPVSPVEEIVSEPKAQEVKQEDKKPKAAPVPTPAKKVAEKAPPKPAPKKTASPKPEPKKEVKPKPSKPKPQVEVAPKNSNEEKPRTIDPQKQKALQEKLASLKESQSKMQAITSEKSVALSSSSLPKQIATLHSDTVTIEEIGRLPTWGAKESTYHDKIVEFLRKNLKLQEKGAVKLRVTINRSGKITAQAVIRSDSRKNQEFVLKALSSLSFPPFEEEQFKGATDYTVMITLDNE